MQGRICLTLVPGGADGHQRGVCRRHAEGANAHPRLSIICGGLGTGTTLSRTGLLKADFGVEGSLPERPCDADSGGCVGNCSTCRPLCAPDAVGVAQDGTCGLTLFHEFLEHRGLVLLARGQEHHQRMAVIVATDMNLGRKPVTTRD